MDNFNRNLRAGFGISLLLLIVSSLLSYYSIDRLINSSRMVDHTQQVLQEAEKVITNIKDGETGQRGYLLTGQSDFLRPYNGAIDRAQAAIRSLRSLTMDNPEQQDNIDTLELLVNKRFDILALSIDMKRDDRPIDLQLLREGHVHMQRVRILIEKIQQREQLLLKERTANLNKFVAYTPYVILAAAIIAIVITIVFFRRVMSEFTQKNKLALSLRRADAETRNRITIIEALAGQIASGDYTIRLNAEEHDQLGSLSGSLNSMAISLDQTFRDLQQREWQQTGVAGLSEVIAGEKSAEEIATTGLEFICSYTDSQVGGFYLVDTADTMLLAGSYALPDTLIGTRIKKQEGLAGQCWADERLLQAKGIDDHLFTPAAGGTVHPRELLLSPVIFEKTVVGVIEIGTVHHYKEADGELISSISDILGVMIHTAQNRSRLKELLEETQAQAEELQSQHRELENMNAELEAQTEKLQTSEEELKVQQEELQEANQGLEERSRLLEDKNHQIVLRNLDIQKKAEELAQSTRYKSEFLANMSHELRTPLNSVLLLSRLLGENPSGNLSKEQIEYAEVIQSSGNGLLQLIDEILDLSKIEAGKLDLDYERIQVIDIVQQMRQLFGPMAKEKNLELRLKTDPAAPLMIETDKLRIEQILKNLLSNALKFTHTGFIELHIAQPAEQPDHISFTVRDSGIGIPADKQQLIFEAFQQADGSTKRKFGGTGLGLSISRELARLLGGDIQLQSEPGTGSSFSLVIPAFRQMPVVAEPVLPSFARPERVSPVQAQVNQLLAAHIPEPLPDDRHLIQPGDKVLLIVEDDLHFAKALIDFARDKSYKIIHAVRGDEVLSLALKHEPAGILLDIQLPVKDGLTVLDELKQDARTRHIPVHILSSFEVRRESITRGAVDFMHKPVAQEQMNAVLEKIEYMINTDEKKVLIVEDNSKHAQALAYFLSIHQVPSTICTDITDSIGALERQEVNCVILDLGNPNIQTYTMLDEIKQHGSLDHVPIIVFTGRNFSRSEEQRVRQYADTIVVKTAHSYQRILNEVSLFLHLMNKPETPKGLGTMDEVLKGKRVLIADDDVRNIFALSKALEKHRIQVVTAIDGKEVMQLLEREELPDLILMDMMMPEMDGYEAIARIKGQPAWSSIPIIAVTAKAMSGDREKCIEVGASDYISKPVDTDQLLSLMRVWLYDSK